MSRLISFFNLATNWGDDHSGAVGVANIILNDKNRSETILFTSDNGAEVSKENIASMDFVDNHIDTSVLVVSLWFYCSSNAARIKDCKKITPQPVYQFVFEFICCLDYRLRVNLSIHLADQLRTQLQGRRGKLPPQYPLGQRALETKPKERIVHRKFLNRARTLVYIYVRFGGKHYTFLRVSMCRNASRRLDTYLTMTLPKDAI